MANVQQRQEAFTKINGLLTRVNATKNKLNSQVNILRGRSSLASAQSNRANVNVFLTDLFRSIKGENQFKQLFNELGKNILLLNSQVKEGIFSTFNNQQIIDDKFINNYIELSVENVDFLEKLFIDPTSNDGRMQYNENSLDFFLYQTIQNSSKINIRNWNNIFYIYYEEENESFFIKVNERFKGRSISEFNREYINSINFFYQNTLYQTLVNNLTGVSDLIKNRNFKNKATKVNRVLSKIKSDCGEDDIELFTQLNAIVDEVILEPEDFDTLQENPNTYINGLDFYLCGGIKITVDQETLIRNYNNYDTGLNKKKTQNAKSNSLGNSLERLLDEILINNLGSDFDGNSQNLQNLRNSFFSDNISNFDMGLNKLILSPQYFLLIQLDTLFAGQVSIGSLDILLKRKINLVSIVSKLIFGIFRKLLYNLIRRELISLVRQTAKEIKNEQLRNLRIITSSLRNLLNRSRRGNDNSIENNDSQINNFNDCQEINNEVLEILNLNNLSISGGIGFNFGIPFFLLAMAKFRPGISRNRTYLNYVDNLEKLGVDVGPLPDGSPNLMVAAGRALIDSIYDDILQNMSVESTGITAAGAPFKATGVVR